MDIDHLIKEFVRTYRELHKTETDWLEPIIGVADADDELFRELKTIVSPTHAMPKDIVPGAKSVIAYFVPFVKDIVISNIPEEESSREWDYAYIETNNMLGDLSRYLHDKIAEWGYQASLLPPTYNYDTKLLRSDWSHRSAAYIAGIGKFGINNMLITEKGCCGRVGSVITDMELPVTEREDAEYCLYKNGRHCAKCVERCVNHAFCIDKSGEIEFDRWKCNEQIYDKIVPHYPIGDGDTCGKCMCGIPCSFVNPSRRISGDISRIN